LPTLRDKTICINHRYLPNGATEDGASRQYDVRETPDAREELEARLYTPSEIKDIADVNYWVVQHCIEAGMNPARLGAKGRGKASLFTWQQVLGVAYANRLRDSGCPNQVAWAAARWVSEAKWSEVQKAFRQGRTMLLVLPPHQENFRLFMPTKGTSQEDMDALSLERCYLEVVRRARKYVNVRTEMAEMEQE
jgi:hypothetical protein